MEPPEPVRENVVLVGFMGTGKSTIGRHVARIIGFQFIDVDRLISDREGAPIPELFARRGEDAFRALETETLQSLDHLRRCVIATGGGSVVREENRLFLRRLGFVVGLTASESVIFERVSRNQKRPLLHTENPRGTVHALLTSRAEAYREAAQFVIDTSVLGPPAIAGAIVEQARGAFSWNRRS